MQWGKIQQKESLKKQEKQHPVIKAPQSQGRVGSGLKHRSKHFLFWKKKMGGELTFFWTLILLNIIGTSYIWNGVSPAILVCKKCHSYPQFQPSKCEFLSHADKQHHFLHAELEKVSISSYSPPGAGGKEFTCQCRRRKRHRFDSWVGKITSFRRRAWHLTLVFLPGESHGQRSLVGYSPWAHKESDTTEAT